LGDFFIEKFDISRCIRQFQKINTMKHFKIVLFATVIFSFLSFQQSESITGKWELFKMEAGEEVRETSGYWMHFMKDGVLKGGDTLDKTERTGNWTYDTETQELTFSSEKKLSGEGTYKINWIDADTMYMVIDRGRKMYFKRIS
jgi:hypothetical protein